MSFKTIFCIIDPTTNTQRALDRVQLLADPDDTQVHAYACIPPAVGKRQAERQRQQAAEQDEYVRWLEELAEPLRARGYEVRVELEREEDWRGALANAALRNEADLIIKSTYRHSAFRRHLLKTADWLLLRSAHCPVLLVKEEHLEELDRILVAVDIADEDEAHRRLTDAVIEVAQRLAGAAGAELHAVNAYSGSLNRISAQDLSKRVGVERRNVHVGDMRPERLIAETAREIGAPMVVIGTIARSGLSGFIFGNTAERILDSVEEDMLSVVHTQ